MYHITEGLADTAECEWTGATTFQNGGRCDATVKTTQPPTTQAPTTTESAAGEICRAITKKGLCSDDAAGCEWTGATTFKNGGRCDAAAPTAADSELWFFKGRKRKNCAWTKGKKARCKKTATIDGIELTGFEACLTTCLA
jgi:hypothetical protein